MDRLNRRIKKWFNHQKEEEEETTRGWLSCLKKQKKKKNRKNPHHSLTRVISTASNAANAKEKGTKIRNKVWRLKLEARHKNFIHLLKQTHVLEPTCAHTPVGFMAVQENSCQWTHRSEFLWNGWRRRRRPYVQRQRRDSQWTGGFWAELKPSHTLHRVHTGWLVTWEMTYARDGFVAPDDCNKNIKAATCRLK